jgi:hypothetical protein
VIAVSTRRTSEAEARTSSRPPVNPSQPQNALLAGSHTRDGYPGAYDAFLIR